MTSGRARRPARQRAAETGAAPNGGPVSGATAAGGPMESAAQVPDEPAVPGGEQELRQEIEQTREWLGETVEQLAAKADVKAQARAKAAAQLIGRVKAKTAMARQKASAAGGTAKAGFQARAAPVWEKAPEPVRRSAAKTASTARQRRVPLAAATATLIAVYLALRWWRKR